MIDNNYNNDNNNNLTIWSDVIYYITFYCMFYSIWFPWLQYCADDWNKVCDMSPCTYCLANITYFTISDFHFFLVGLITLCITRSPTFISSIIEPCLETEWDLKLNPHGTAIIKSKTKWYQAWLLSALLW